MEGRADRLGPPAIPARERGIAIGGFMAVGKSTAAPRIAALVGLPAVDLDDEVVRQVGLSVAEIFERQGEFAFRAAERRVLERIVAAGPSVIALGGGTLHNDGCGALLEPRFDIVVLDLPWEVLQSRLRGGTGRPLADEARALHERRRAGYRAAGRLVDVTGADPEAVARAVVDTLEVRRAAS